MRFRLPTVGLGWRAFLAEVAIVVLGVILGLGATQFVADRNTEREIRNAKVALHGELANSFGSVERRHRMSRCVERKIEDLRKWIATHRRSDTAVLPDNIGIPGSRIVFTSVWDATKGGEVASNMSLKERLQYGKLYDSLISYQNLGIDERDLWYEIGDFSGMTLNDRDLARLNGLVKRVDSYQRQEVENYRSLAEAFGKLRIRPETDPSPPGPRSLRRVMCRQLDAAG